MVKTLKMMIDDKGLRQDWVARAINVPPASFYRWLNGGSVFPATKIRLLATALNMPIESVLAAIEQTMKGKTDGATKGIEKQAAAGVE